MWCFSATATVVVVGWVLLLGVGCGGTPREQGVANVKTKDLRPNYWAYRGGQEQPNAIQDALPASPTPTTSPPSPPQDMSVVYEAVSNRFGKGVSGEDAATEESLLKEMGPYSPDSEDKVQLSPYTDLHEVPWGLRGEAVEAIRDLGQGLNCTLCKAFMNQVYDEVWERFPTEHPRDIGTDELGRVLHSIRHYICKVFGPAPFDNICDQIVVGWRNDFVDSVLHGQNVDRFCMHVKMCLDVSEGPDLTSEFEEDQRIATSLTASIPSTSVTLRHLPDGLHIRLQSDSGDDNDVLFDRGTVSLSPVARRRLSAIATVLKSFPGRALVVSAHTDAQDSGVDSLDWTQHLAVAVKTFLQEQGVSNKMQAVGAGNKYPVATDEDEWGSRLNRRVELWIIDTKHIQKTGKVGLDQPWGLANEQFVDNEHWLWPHWNYHSMGPINPLGDRDVDELPAPIRENDRIPDQLKETNEALDEHLCKMDEMAINLFDPMKCSTCKAIVNFLYDELEISLARTSAMIAYNRRNWNDARFDHACDTDTSTSEEKDNEKTDVKDFECKPAPPGPTPGLPRPKPYLRTIPVHLDKKKKKKTEDKGRAEVAVQLPKKDKDKDKQDKEEEEMPFTSGSDYDVNDHYDASDDPDHDLSQEGLSALQLESQNDWNERETAIDYTDVRQRTIKKERVLCILDKICKEIAIPPFDWVCTILHTELATLTQSLLEELKPKFICNYIGFCLADGFTPAPWADPPGPGVDLEGRRIPERSILPQLRQRLQELKQQQKCKNKCWCGQGEIPGHFVTKDGYPFKAGSKRVHWRNPPIFPLPNLPGRRESNAFLHPSDDYNWWKEKTGFPSPENPDHGQLVTADPTQDIRDKQTRGEVVEGMVVDHE